jgi:hypothetical protein
VPAATRRRNIPRYILSPVRNMLEAEVLTHIRNTVAAELAQRDADLRLALQGAQRQLTARGLGRSGNALYEQADLGAAELEIRAQLIWDIIQRCQSTFGRPGVPDLLGGVQQQVAEYLTDHAAAVLATVDIKETHGMPPATTTFIRDRLNTKRDQLIAKYQNDANFYVRAVTRPPATVAPAAAVIVNGGVVYSLQTGDYANATIHIDAAGVHGLLQANTALMEAIKHAADMSDDQRAQSLDIAADLVTAAQAQRPNGPKMHGLLGGLATGVQTVASVKPAWDAVKTAAAAIGLPLPF